MKKNFGVRKDGVAKLLVDGFHSTRFDEAKTSICSLYARGLDKLVGNWLDGQGRLDER